MKYHCRCRHQFGIHVKSEKNDSILECTYPECTCEEYEEQSNDNDVYQEEMSFEEHEHYDSLDSDEDLLKENQEVLGDLDRHPPFVDRISDEEADRLT